MCSKVNAVFFPFSDAWPFLFLWRIFSWPSGKFMPCNNTNREFNCQGSVSTLRTVSLFLQIQECMSAQAWSDEAQETRCLRHLAPSVTRVVICLALHFAGWTKNKERLLIV